MPDYQLTVFSEQPYNHKPRLKRGEKVVISASRRTDLVKWYPQEMLALLAKNYPPPKVHTVVIWTKFVDAILAKPVRQALKNYDSLYVHLTCTGMGGTEIEPLVPEVAETFKQLPDLVQFIGGAMHLKLRIDPVFRARKAGMVYTNLSSLKEILMYGAELGIKHYTTSFVYPYPKVQRQLAAAGFEIWEFNPEEQQEISADLGKLSKSLGIELAACAVPGLPESRCIDAALLTQLHPHKTACSSFEPRTRDLCGCTHSVDIGGFYTKPCFSGCLYCFANMRRPI